MSFIAAVNALRQALDMPPNMPVAVAVTNMSTLMGEPVVRDDGSRIPLPEQVATLLEVTGVVVEEDAEAGDTTEQHDEGRRVDEPSTSSNKKAKKQRALLRLATQSAPRLCDASSTSCHRTHSTLASCM